MCKTLVYHIAYCDKLKEAYIHFYGCNLDCKGCIRKRALRDVHLKSRTVESEHQIRFLSIEEIIAILKRAPVQRVFFMGFESTIDPMLPEIAEALHEEFGTYNILLTNGLVIPKLDNIDEVVVSIKAYSRKLHEDYTGKPNDKILENFRKYYETGVRLRAESVLIPKYIDVDEIEKIAKFIASVDENIPYRIDAYIPVEGAPWRKPTLNEIRRAVERARRYLKRVSYLSGNEKVIGNIIKLY